MKTAILAFLLCVVVAAEAQGLLGASNIDLLSQVADPLTSQVQKLVGGIALPADLQKRLNDVVSAALKAIKDCDLLGGDGCVGLKLAEVKKAVEAIVNQAKLLNGASSTPAAPSSTPVAASSAPQAATNAPQAATNAPQAPTNAPQAATNAPGN